MSSNNEIEKNLDYYANKLDEHTFNLRIFSIILFVFLLANIFVSVLLLLFFRKSSFFFQEIYFFFIFIPFLGILFLFFYNHLKKQAFVIYEILVEEIEWNFNSENKKNNERLPIEIRVKIKKFLSSVDLPLAPGKFGQGIYFSLFLILIILNAYIYKMFV